MTRQKIAITLPEEQVAAARQAVAEGRAASVSSYISEALARRTAEEEMAEIIVSVAICASDREHPVVTGDPGGIAAIDPTLTLVRPT